MRANSTIRSPFRWIGLRRLWLFTRLYKGVSFTLNSVFIPISILPFCVLQKYHGSLPDYVQLLVFRFLMAVYRSNQIFQEFFFEILCRLLDSVFFFSFSSYSPLRIRVCFGVWSSILPGFSGVGIQKVFFFLFWFVCSERFIQVGSQVQITFRNHTENCLIYWLNERGLFRSDYAKFGNLCVRFD